MDCLYGGSTIGKDPFKLLFNSQFLRDKIVKPKTANIIARFESRMFNRNTEQYFISDIKLWPFSPFQPSLGNNQGKRKFHEEISSKLEFA